jgi:hypothetical protein
VNTSWQFVVPKENQRQGGFNVNDSIFDLTWKDIAIYIVVGAALTVTQAPELWWVAACAFLAAYFVQQAVKRLARRTTEQTAKLQQRIEWLERNMAAVQASTDELWRAKRR